MILDREVIAVKSPQYIPPRAASVMWLGMDAMLTFPKVLFTHDKTQGPADALNVQIRLGHHIPSGHPSRPRPRVATRRPGHKVRNRPSDQELISGLTDTKLDGLGLLCSIMSLSVSPSLPNCVTAAARLR